MPNTLKLVHATEDIILNCEPQTHIVTSEYFAELKGKLWIEARAFLSDFARRHGFVPDMEALQRQTCCTEDSINEVLVIGMNVVVGDAPSGEINPITPLVLVA